MSITVDRNSCHSSARRRLLGAVAGLAVSSTLGCAAPSRRPLAGALPGTSRGRHGISYGPEPEQRLDLYQPSSDTEVTATVLFVHGGAWRSGSRSLYRFVGHRLANAGYRVVIPGYRKYPAAPYPAFVEDIARVLWLMADAPSRLGLGAPTVPVIMGHSSGAHTAALLAAQPTRWLGDVAYRPQAFIGLSGPYDLPLNNSEVEPVFAKRQSDAEVLPIRHVSAAHPPTLLIHGTDDTRVKPLHSDRLANALQRAGVQHRLEWIEGAGHMSTVAALASPLRWLNRADNAVLRYLESLPGQMDRASHSVGGSLAPRHT